MKMSGFIYSKLNAALISKSRCLICFRVHSTWRTETVRSTFIDYFKGQGHEFVPSSSVIPRPGEGTYFTNAGMNQFKPIILGEADPKSKFQYMTRAVNSQKCIRVGGKHNDLDDVGHDLTHHTFFEMLGSWSFGDYFKTEACRLAYQLLTEEFRLPLDRLYFTYFAGDPSLKIPMDEECRDIWLSQGIPKERVLPFGAKDNFWDMGLVGPCGPCTEIHFDHSGHGYAGSEVNSGSPSVVEIWNLVFMQYNRESDQSLKPLPACHVDTGMGLERMTAVLNGSADNYSIDVFTPMFQLIEKYSCCPPYQGNKDEINTGYRMLADHARMFTVAISDGLLPSNDDLGHKLRSILHRCIHLCREVFHVDPQTVLPGLVSLVVESLSSSYPELSQNEQRVTEIVKSAIAHHDKNREQAVKSFNKMLSKALNDQRLSGDVILALEKGFYGSPMSVETIENLARINDLTLDLQDYQRIVESRKTQVSNERLRSVPDQASVLVNSMMARNVAATDDRFKYQYALVSDDSYDFSVMAQESCPCHIQGMSSQGEVIDIIVEGNQGEVILDHTCFYAESGGQEADIGELVTETGIFQVSDVQNLRGYVVHYGFVSEGSVQSGQAVESRISQTTRLGCMCNHTATHILNSALLEVLPSTQQQGSSVTSQKLTFDFLALNPLETSGVEQVEARVREVIKQEFPVSRTVMALEEALALPEVKTLQNMDYPEQVSLIAVGSLDGSLTVSRELCGGTHVVDTSHLGDFCITSLTTKSQNVKRLTCVTGDEAQQAHRNGDVVRTMCQLLRTLTNMKEITPQDCQKLESLVNQAKTSLKRRRERLEHTLTRLVGKDSEHSSRIRQLLADNEKAVYLVESLNSSTSQLKEKLQDTVEVMRQLISLIKKAQELELLPRTIREEAHFCLEDLERKVVEVSNKKNGKLMLECIENSIEKVPENEPVMVQLDEIDLSTRQVVKTLLKKQWDRQLILIQESAKAKTISIIVSVPFSRFQPYSLEDWKNIAQRLSCLGPVSPPQTKENKNVAVYTFTIQGRRDSDDIVKFLMDERIFER